MGSVLLLGFLMGLRHAVEADHVAAVATLSAQSKTQNSIIHRAIKLGALWGLGHALALFSIGALFIGLNISAPAGFSDWLEFAVGIMLMVLGVDLLYRLVKKRIHFHVHRHEDGHVHFHAHSHANTMEHSHPHDRVASWRSLIIGMMHGMAGSAALVVLAAGAFRSYEMSLLYMAIFAIGSMAGMVVLSFIIALPLRTISESLSWVHNGIQFALSLLTIGVGASLSVLNMPPNVLATLVVI